jgi:hypothetical protein
LADIAFQVYNNHNQKEERREQNKERRQAKLMAAAIDAPMPKRYPQTKAGKLSCFKCKKLGHMARNCTEPPQYPVMNAPK